MWLALSEESSRCRFLLSYMLPLRNFPCSSSSDSNIFKLVNILNGTMTFTKQTPPTSEVLLRPPFSSPFKKYLFSAQRTPNRPFSLESALGFLSEGVLKCQSFLGESGRIKKNVFAWLCFGVSTIKGTVKWNVKTDKKIRIYHRKTSSLCCNPPEGPKKSGKIIVNYEFSFLTLPRKTVWHLTWKIAFVISMWMFVDKHRPTEASERTFCAELEIEIKKTFSRPLTRSLATAAGWRGS